MRIRVVAVGTRLPGWAETAVAEYARRMPPECAVEVVAVAAAPRARRPDIPRILQREAEAIRRKIPDGALCLALDERGKSLSTVQLAERLGGWLGEGRDVCLLIGGADGLEASLKQRAEGLLALSALTLPHALARVLLVEALYRAWTMHSGHPYHRA